MLSPSPSSETVQRLLKQAQNSHQGDLRHLLIRAASAGAFGPKSAWDLVQLRAWTGPIEKMPRRGEGPIWHHTAERQAEFATSGIC
jgi:hypothetical protein